MQSPKNKLYIAAAGAGKTTFIINEAVSHKEKQILITTFTENNEVEIRNKFKRSLGYVPGNVTIQTWFSFLLEHGVRPYQSFLFEERVAGLQLVSKQSAPRTNSGQKIHYFNNNNDIYSDKISKLVCRINEASRGLVISRLSRIYNSIYIDEVQDLSGYDLELVKLIACSVIQLILVGDPRQVTYHTHWEKKYSDYTNGKIEKFIADHCREHFVTDKETLQRSFRNNEAICSFSSQLFPEYVPTTSVSKNEKSEHEGIFYVHEQDVDYYLERYHPVQLRNAKSQKVNDNYPVYTFGDSKGKTFGRVLIYLTQPMRKWLSNRREKLKFQSRCRAYVAVTRAIHSVAFVIKNNDDIKASDIKHYDPNGLNLP